MKLADVLWDAANVHLSADNFSAWEKQIDYFSCCAVEYAAGDGDLEAKRFLKSLGCDTASTTSFLSFRPGIQRQGVRYMWLLLAMHVAEDEGIEI